MKETEINSVKSKKGRYILPAIVTALAVAFIIVGIFSGEAADIFRKAITICLECIGVG